MATNMTAVSGSEGFKKVGLGGDEGVSCSEDEEAGMMRERVFVFGDILSSALSSDDASSPPPPPCCVASCKRGDNAQGDDDDNGDDDEGGGGDEPPSIARVSNLIHIKSFFFKKIIITP